jgi:Uma2 family endonuclease
LIAGGFFVILKGEHLRRQAMLEITQVAPDYDRSWVPEWARDKPILKIGDKDPPYTYADWLEWPLPEEGTMELISGLLVSMAMPTSVHGGIEGDIYGQIWSYLRGKKGRVFSSGFAVRLFPDGEKHKDRFTVAPDIVVVLDTTKITLEGCQGAPDFIVEILSPSNKKDDLITKLDLYREAGVREYWIVDPDLHTIQVNLLKDGEYVLKMYAGGTVPVTILPGLEVDFGAVFAYADVGQLDH